MTLPEQLTRRFTNTQIEIREPKRRELDIQTAEFLARGGNVIELPNKLGTPRPTVPRPETKPKERPQNLLAKIEVQPFPWSNQAENDRMFILTQSGLKYREVANILNAEFNSNRNESSVRGAALRYKEGTLGDVDLKKKYSADEDSWLLFMTKYGFTPIEIADALNQYFGVKIRSSTSVKHRSYALQVKTNRITAMTGAKQRRVHRKKVKL